jgi:hypothetical protein
MNFQQGVPPDEAETGECRVLGRRTCQSSVLVSVKVSVQVNAQSALGQNACPDSGSGVILRRVEVEDQEEITVC